MGILQQRRLVFSRDEGHANLYRPGAELMPTKLPSRADLILSLTEGRVQVMELRSTQLDEPWELNFRVTAYAEQSGNYSCNPAQVIAEIICLTEHSETTVDLATNGELHMDYSLKPNRLESKIWLPVGFDQKAYINGHISAQDARFGADGLCY